MRNLEVPAKYRKLYDKALSGKSAKAAIRCHCIMCMGWSSREVPGCTAPGCPLFKYRCRSAVKQRTSEANLPRKGQFGCRKPSGEK